MIDHTSEIIDEFIRQEFGEESFDVMKTLLRVAFIAGRLDMAKFAKDAGVSESAVRRHFGGGAASEPEGADEHDNDDETEAATRDATQILSQQIDLLERDSNRILETANRDFKTLGGGYSDTLLINQVNALNNQLNILTRMFAIHARNTLKEGEGR